jgi:hypothetical protein
MGAWIAWAWPQIWPNIAADVLWQPVALGAGLWWHHTRIRRLLVEHHRQLAELRHELERSVPR